MNIIPLKDRVLVRRLAKEERTLGGILLPDVAQEKSCRGVVVSLGEKVSSAIKPGDIVMLNKWGGTEFHSDGLDYVILKDEEILGIVKE